MSYFDLGHYPCPQHMTHDELLNTAKAHLYEGDVGAANYYSAFCISIARTIREIAIFTGMYGLDYAENYLLRAHDIKNACAEFMLKDLERRLEDNPGILITADNIDALKLEHSPYAIISRQLVSAYGCEYVLASDTNQS